jgi:hypothetical protein
MGTTQTQVDPKNLTSGRGTVGPKRKSVKTNLHQTGAPQNAGALDYRVSLMANPALPAVYT